MSKRELEFLLIGESRTGKTTLVHKLGALPMSGPLQPTQGIHTYVLNETADSDHTKVVFSDTCGLNHMKAELFPCIETAHAVLLVYDISRISTFKAVQYWLYFWSGAQNCSQVKLIFLIGTILDPNTREVSFEAGSTLAREYDSGFCEVSLSRAQDERPLFQMLLAAAKKTNKKKKRRRFLSLLRNGDE